MPTVLFKGSRTRESQCGKPLFDHSSPSLCPAGHSSVIYVIYDHETHLDTPEFHYFHPIATDPAVSLYLL